MDEEDENGWKERWERENRGESSAYVIQREGTRTLNLVSSAKNETTTTQQFLHDASHQTDTAELVTIGTFIAPIKSQWCSSYPSASGLVPL